MLHHTRLSPPGIWGHHLSVIYLITVPYLKCFHCLVGFSSCTLLLWALKLLFVVELYISSLDPNRFDVTLESFLFVMWYLNFVLLLKDLSHKLQGDSIFVWTSRLWSLRRVSLENCLPQKLHTSSELIFLKYASFCCY